MTLTAMVLGAVVFGVGGIGIWMYGRRRRENAVPPPTSDQPETRGSRRR